MSQPEVPLTEKQRVFAEALLASHAVKFGAFRLKLHETQLDAPLSPIYVDLRVLQSYPDALDAAVAALAELIEAHKLTFTRYAGIPMAATPLVAVLSHITRVPMITPRETKTHGTVETINGAFIPGETVLAVDDVVSHAESKLQAIRTLEANSLIVRDVAVLVDREQGGAAQLAAAGYTLHAAVRLSQLLAYWLASGGIDNATYERVRGYFNYSQESEVRCSIGTSFDQRSSAPPGAIPKSSMSVYWLAWPRFPNQQRSRIYWRWPQRWGAACHRKRNGRSSA